MFSVRCFRIRTNPPGLHTHTHAHTHARTHARTHTRTHARTYMHARTNARTLLLDPDNFFGIFSYGHIFPLGQLPLSTQTYPPPHHPPPPPPRLEILPLGQIPSITSTPLTPTSPPPTTATLTTLPYTPYTPLALVLDLIKLSPCSFDDGFSSKPGGFGQNRRAAWNPSVLIELGSWVSVRPSFNAQVGGGQSGTQSIPLSSPSSLPPLPPYPPSPLPSTPTHTALSTEIP